MKKRRRRNEETKKYLITLPVALHDLVKELHSDDNRCFSNIVEDLLRKSVGDEFKK